MNELYTAIDVAKFIIDYCAELDVAISNLKLQKILYFAWIDFYKKTKTYLFEDSFCAWQHGPVVPDVYYEYCSYAGIPITRLHDTDFESDKWNANSDMLKSIIDTYSPMSPAALVNKSHEPGKAWDMIYNGEKGIRSIIPFELIIDTECENEQ